MGLFCTIPLALLLTVSFFVLLALSKVGSKSLRGFAIAIVILLWISALLVASCGIYTLTTGTCPMMKCMKEMKMMQRPMMHEKMMMQHKSMKE